MGDHIFISYSRVDSIFADQLAADLESRGYQVWIDQVASRGGDEWRDEIEQNLRSAQEVVVVLSETSSASRWVNHQGSLADGLEKKIIPLALAPDLSFPVWAAEKQAIACYSEADYTAALETLADSLYPPPVDVDRRLRDIGRRLLVTDNDYGLTRLQLEIEAALRDFPEEDRPREARLLLQKIQRKKGEPVPAGEPGRQALPGKRGLPKWVWIAGMLLCLLAGMLPVLFREQITAALFSSPTSTASQTIAWTLTSTSPPTSTLTFTAAPSATSTSSPSATLSPTATLTPTITLTPTLTLTPSSTPTPTRTPSPTRTPTPTSTLTPTPTRTPTPTITPSPTPTRTPTPTPSLTLTPSSTATPTPTATRTPTPTITPSPTPTRTPTLTPSSTATPTATRTPTATITPSATPTPVFCALDDFEDGRQNDWLPPDPAVYWYWDLYDLSMPHPGQGALAVNYYRPEPDQYMAFEVTVDCDFSGFGRLQMWVYREATLQLALEDRASREIELGPDAALDPEGWTLLEFEYASAGEGIDLGAVKTVKIFIVPDDPTDQGRIVLDEIILVP